MRSVVVVDLPNSSNAFSAQWRVSRQAAYPAHTDGPCATSTSLQNTKWHTKLEY